MSTNQRRLINYFDQFTSVLNYTYDEIHANRYQLPLLNGKLRQFAATVHHDYDYTLQQIKLLSNRVNFEVLISQMEDVSRTYVRSHEAWLHRRKNLELGKVSESLLPPQVLCEILSPANSDQAYIIDPVEWYYEHIIITPIWLDDLLVYRTKLPVVSTEQWHYVQLWKWPAPIQDYQVTVLVPDVILRDTRTGQLDISLVCYGERPRICRKGLVNPARLYPCITRLLSESPGYDPQCLVTP